MSLCQQIQRAIVAGETIAVPKGIKPVQIQSYAHTIAHRLGVLIYTKKVVIAGAIYISIRQTRHDGASPLAIKVMRNEERRQRDIYENSRRGDSSGI